jgi:hypothetical protein
MLGRRRRDSCRNLFKELEILPLASQYILSLIIFITKNGNKLIANSEIHGINTRQQNNLYQPLANLSKYQKGIYYLGTKVYNNLPQHIKDTSDYTKVFEAKLKQFLHLHSFIHYRNIFVINLH